MSKIVKNTTISDIELKEVGITVPASDSYTIVLQDYLLWADTDSISEITPLINSGDIVINDGINDLSAANGIRFLEYTERLYIEEDSSPSTKVVSTLNFEGDVTITDEGGGKTKITVGTEGVPKGKLFDFSFGKTGLARNVWLEFSSSSAPSNSSPLVCPYGAELIALTFSNTSDDKSTDAEIYKNGVLETTWQIRNKRTAFKSDFSGVNFAQGDRVSLFIREFTMGDNPTTPIIEFYFNITDDTPGEGGTQNGV